MLGNVESNILGDFKIYIRHVNHHRYPDTLVVKIIKDKLTISGSDVQWDATSNMGDKYDEEIDWYKEGDPGMAGGWQFSRILLLLDVVESGVGGWGREGGV